ncbi:signal transduction histidine kinase [Paenibacillus endophyticus]|uniref:histidine kinase n=1 Tax=Paenibacillus endophyticus TaxID=1294268 RepID=A0A7W5C801_9BACL|nr:histidine kinase N-terminal 7TM domain-containing protein [Paenibacillus endophyticus]MBB3152822.1 signal transduction histidine kinase [Paenibacillus endophyticus]
MSYNIYLSVFLMAAACCAIIICYLCWKRRDLPISVSYGLGMLTGVFYTFGYAFEIVSTSLDHIRFWLRLEYMGIPFGTLFWFIMVLQYTGRQALVNKRVVAALMSVPMITFIAHHTNELHHLFYKSMTLDYSEGFPVLVLEKGPLYYTHVYYSYVFFVIGTVMLVRMFLKETPRIKKQVALMIIGSWGPFGFALIYVSDIVYMPIDISPFGFVFSGIFYMWGIYQFNMLRLAPLAHQKMFESMQDAVIVLDMDNSLMSFNQSAAETIQSLSKKKIGQPAAAIFSEYPLLLERVVHLPFHASHTQISGHLDELFFNIHMSYVNNSRRKPVGKMILLIDVTESVRSEQKLLENARQLSELNTFKDKMFNVVAHDIRDPLAVLINLMELIEEEMQDQGESHDELLNEMGQQIKNTFDLVESLLDWFRSQRGGMVFRPVERDLLHAIQSNMRLLSVRSEAKRIHIYTDIPKGVFVYADKEMLDLIIRNLLSNAIKFTDFDGSIRIKAEISSNKVTVSVNDTGLGIPNDQADKLLQEAYPSSLAGTAGERGVGLGLTLCKEFVQLNGGEIWFESKPSQGSTFYFTIPIPPSESSSRYLA